jgi:hypothetical protein
MSIDLNPVIDSEWVAATYTRNYVLNDPLLDWLNLYGKQKGFLKDSEKNAQNSLKNNLNFTQYIMKKGQEFENYVIEQIRDNHREFFSEVRVGKVYPVQKRYIQHIQATYSLMKQGVKIIYQGMVFNPFNKTFGFPDLIVRSDYLNELFDHKVISLDKMERGCRFSDKWHYRVIDIKYFCMKLNSDELIKNSSGTSVLCYKVQSYIYNQALGYMQFFIPRKSYILGRGCYEDNIKIFNPFYKCGHIDYCREDVKADSNSAVEWIRDVRMNGATWEIDEKQQRVELYPNMTNTMDYDWHHTKTEIASRLSELTSLWQCGIKNRNIAFSKGVYKWADPRCSADILNVSDIYSSKVNRIIDINRNSASKIYNIDIELLKKHHNCVGKSFFIDFENVSNIDRVNGQGVDMVFMIGCGHYTETENWVFSNFCVDLLSYGEEKKIIEEFLHYLKTESNGEKCILYHYNHTEPNLLLKTLIKYNICIDFEIEWIDLLDVLKKSNFVIRGCFDYSLKHIISSLKHHNFIDISYTDSDVCDGLEAMVGAFLVNDEVVRNQQCKFKNHYITNSIVYYNEIDCKSLKSLNGFLKKIALQN